MNILKASVASIVAVVFAQSAFADVTIRITGSSAFRAATHNAIKNVMDLSGTNNGYAYQGTNFTGSNFAIFKGTIQGIPGTVTVKTSWSGSVAGLRDVVQSKPVAFLPDSTPVSSGGTQNASTTSNESVIPDVAMSDTFQGSTKYTSTTLVDDIVGIIPFAWVASKDAPASLTNITSQLARGLYKNGNASAALFTNNNADASDLPAGTTVYAAGRDPFSGTRLTAFAESGIGVNTVVAQYEPSTVSSNTVTEIRLTLANPTENVDVGDNGYASGGNLADILRYSTPSVKDTNTGETNKKICFVGYLGETDAARAVYGTGSAVTGTNAGNARYLSYNGVSAFGGVAATFTNASVANGSTTVTTTGSTAGLIVGQAVRGTGTNGGFIPSNATIASITNGTTFTISSPATGTGTVATVSVSTLLPEAIRNGAYTFWGYEHIMWRQGLTGDGLSVADKIRTQIKNTDYSASGLANDAAMRVSRLTDGGTVTQQY
ncbi:hypothetical protein ACXR0O_13125 [Verrucomicrobiota bacterium sgz303538]